MGTGYLINVNSIKVSVPYSSGQSLQFWQSLQEDPNGTSFSPLFVGAVVAIRARRAKVEHQHQ